MTNSKRQKLELTWIGKENRPKLEPRILLEDPAKSYHAKFRNPPRPLGQIRRERIWSGEARPQGSGQDCPETLGQGVREDLFDNRLIFGDNLLALKALEAEFAGKVKCVFIDPPYNTGSAFEHYDDGVEHSIWLSLMRDRLEIIRRLLSEDGSLWITIDDNEAHYLKVLCDEVYGRANFVANVVWQKAYTSNQTAMHISNTHDHALVYARDASAFQIGKVPRTEEQKNTFSNPDNDPRGVWKAENLSAGKFYAAGQFPIGYVTTAMLSHEQLQQLSDEVGPERTLLVLCTAFRARADAYPNLTVKKIPKQVLSRCEWGRDDYSLRVENLPQKLPHPNPLPEREGMDSETLTPALSQRERGLAVVGEGRTSFGQQALDL